MQKKLDCVASIVVFHNPLEVVRSAVLSFLNSSLRVKVYIIDNSREPDLKEAFQDLPVTYIFSGRNLGYGRANNLAINRSESSKYHLIMNPDVIIPEGVIESLTQYMDENPDVGLICPKVVSDDGACQYLNKRFPTVLDLMLRRFLPKSLQPFFRDRMDRYEMRDVGYDTIYQVPFVSGAFMFCHTESLRQMGGFDPRYFIYFEDVDLSRKFQIRGYKTLYYPYVTVTHTWARASHTSIRMALCFMTSGIKYFNKWGWKWF